MYSTNYSDRSQYLHFAEWLKLTDILNEWCEVDKNSRDGKAMAILGACENGEIAYTRNDGKNFDDPVIDLYGRGILLINKKSFNIWKDKVEKSKESGSGLNITNKSLSDFLNSVDSEYISVNDLVGAIHKNIGFDKDISDAFQILNLAIGRSEDKPHIYKKDNFRGWEKGILTHAHHRSFKPKQFVLESEKNHTLMNAIQIVKDEIFQDDLPF